MTNKTVCTAIDSDNFRVKADQEFEKNRHKKRTKHVGIEFFEEEIDRLVMEIDNMRNENKDLKRFLAKKISEVVSLKSENKKLRKSQSKRGN